MASKYFALVGVCKSTKNAEVIFSDYDRQTVLSEKRETSGYSYMRVIQCKDTDSHSDILAARCLCK